MVNKLRAIRRKWEEQGGICPLCLLPLDLTVANIDHIIPLRISRSTGMANLQAVHPQCNVKKGSLESQCILCQSKVSPRHAEQHWLLVHIRAEMRRLRHNLYGIARVRV